MTGHPLMAFDLASTADTVTRTIIAVLTLVAALLVVIGLGRAWVGRRRAQVVIADVSAVEGIPASAVSGLSPQLRQAVRKALLRESTDASYSVLKTLDQDINGRLLRTRGQMRVKTIAAGLRSVAEDSLTTLAAGVRAVAPKEAEGLLAALGAALPAQRGWAVHVFPVLRGAGQDAEVGVALELAQLGHPPDAVTTFWIGSGALRSPANDEARADAIRALLHLLLNPAALWIATRLVSRQLAESDVPKRWRLLSGRKLRQELAGLQMQLAGQMSLYAARKQKDFDRGFAEQALADLAESARLLPEYFRPHSTEAAVHERLGWSYRRNGDMQQAASEFARAIRDYDDADRVLAAAMGANPAEREAALGRVRVRRTKCRLLSGDRADLVIAQQELAKLRQTTGSTALELYNAACLFAVAMASPGLPSHERSQYEQLAWSLLGRALLAEGEGGPWELLLTDVELDALDAQQRGGFRDEIRIRHPKLTPLAGEAALRVIEEAMHAIGVDHPQHV
ncbi:MAG TPA: hypothetical protein DHU96_15515 [Actinobacteria bacterium]|nr:hypothetical protein [Actinomycetota bacterium]